MTSPLDGIVFGPLPSDTLTICIDMQRLFMEPGEWYCPEALAIVPAVEELVSAYPETVLFTRFITAGSPEDAQGRWAHYYRRWRSVTRAVVGEAAMEIHPQLAVHASPGRTFDKTVHDSFGSREFSAFVKSRDPGALILCGIETEVCVLATALSAVDLGIRTVIATDAVASSDPEAHRAALELIYPRFDQQIELATVAEIIANLSGR